MFFFSDIDSIKNYPRYIKNNSIIVFDIFDFEYFISLYDMSKIELESFFVISYLLYTKNTYVIYYNNIKNLIVLLVIKAFKNYSIDSETFKNLLPKLGLWFLFLILIYVSNIIKKDDIIIIVKNMIYIYIENLYITETDYSIFDFIKHQNSSDMTSKIHGEKRNKKKETFYDLYNNGIESVKEKNYFENELVDNLKSQIEKVHNTEFSINEYIEKKNKLEFPHIIRIKKLNLLYLFLTNNVFDIFNVLLMNDENIGYDKLKNRIFYDFFKYYFKNNIQDIDYDKKIIHIIDNCDIEIKKYIFEKYKYEEILSILYHRHKLFDITVEPYHIELNNNKNNLIMEIGNSTIKLLDNHILDIIQKYYFDNQTNRKILEMESFFDNFKYNIINNIKSEFWKNIIDTKNKILFVHENNKLNFDQKKLLIYGLFISLINLFIQITQKITASQDI